MIRPEQLDWRPEKDALTISETLRHVWVSEEGVRRIALDGNFAYSEKRIPRGLRAMLENAQPLEQELANLERVHRDTLRAVAQISIRKLERGARS